MAGDGAGVTNRCCSGDIVVTIGGGIAGQTGKEALSQWTESVSA